mgnify:CR=1 FL=1
MTVRVFLPSDTTARAMGADTVARELLSLAARRSWSWSWCATAAGACAGWNRWSK